MEASLPRKTEYIYIDQQRLFSKIRHQNNYEKENTIVYRLGKISDKYISPPEFKVSRSRQIHINLYFHKTNTLRLLGDRTSINVIDATKYVILTTITINDKCKHH